MSNYYREQIVNALQVTMIHSPTTYSWFGKLSPQLPPFVKRALTPQSARDYLLFSLQSHLYNNFYCQGSAVTPRQETRELLSVGTIPFVQDLSVVNSGGGYWNEGWEVRAIGNGTIAVRGEDLDLWVRAEDCLAPPGASIVLGMQLSLRFPKEFLGIAPGFYMALSNKAFSRNDPQPLVRLYWNLGAEGAVHFMRSVTSMLNRVDIPFKLKVLNDLSRFTRCDAVVLYIRKSDYSTVSEMLGGIYPEVAKHLRQRIPVFTKLLAVGVGFAEDPGQGESFGQQSCRLLAEGMIRAYEQGKKSVEERLQVVLDYFTEHGISPEKPFLNPGSLDDYTFQCPSKQLPHLGANTAIKSHADPNRRTFLETADEIGWRLSHEAVWYLDHCNWMGTLPQISPYDQYDVSYRTLMPELYSGTSGVALFLAELHAATGNAAARHTALGAIRQALSRADALPPSYRLGFYTGQMGIAFAAARVGRILGQEELLDSAMQLLQHATHDNQDEYEFDVMSGNAGAIVALVILRDMLDNASLLDSAIQLGDKLLQTADKRDTGYSWRSPTFSRHRNLTGFSHGTAGVGYALLELFQATGDSKYSRAAEQAFNYERHWFDADAGNWPDFREETRQSKRGKYPLIFSTTWCHGAPGVTLSRLRAYEILEEETCKAEAVIGLQTTGKIVEMWLDSETGNYSLCHGLTGNAEVLLYGSQVLGRGWTDRPAPVLAVANRGIEESAKDGHLWLCGTRGGETPGLMLGLAGIGYFYLRLYNPAIPSILLLRRESFLHKRA